MESSNFENGKCGSGRCEGVPCKDSRCKSSKPEQEKTDGRDCELSVIVPVYNVEKYLKRCVDSILAQTEKSLEIILVDDGSTDGSGGLCDAYEKSHENIHVLHKPNGGLTSAWKAGLALASGRYTGFIDSDDWIEPDMYERLLTQAKKEQADVTVCGLVFDFEDPKIPKREESSNFKREVYDRASLEELFPTLINDGYFFGRTFQPARVTKLFRTEILRANVKYCDDRVAVGEDMQITFPVLLDTQKLCAVQNFYPYHYWINNKSITGKYDGSYMEKVRLLSGRLLAISKEKAVYDFSAQICNDFLSMTVLAVKNEIYRNYKAGRKTVTRNIKAVCEAADVREALENHTMDKLSASIKLYLYLMKTGRYSLCYWLVLVFFKLNYYLGREYKRQ